MKTGNRNRHWHLLTSAVFLSSFMLFVGCDDSKYEEGNNLNGPFKLTSSSPSDGQTGTEKFNSPYIFLKFNNSLDPEDYYIDDDEMKKQNQYEDMFDIFSPGNNLRIYSVYVLGYYYDDDYSKKSSSGRQDPYANLQQQVRKQAFLSGLEAVDAKAATWYKKQVKDGQRSNSSMEKTTSEDVPNNILVIELERIDYEWLLFDVGQKYRLHVNKDHIVDAFDNKLEEDIDISFTPEPRFRMVDLWYYTDTYGYYSFWNTIFAQFNDKINPASIANTISSQPSHPWTQIVEPYSSQTAIRYNSLEALAQNTTYKITVQGNILNTKGETVSNSLTKTITTDYLRIIDTEPDHGETGVSVNSYVRIEYNNDIQTGIVSLLPATDGSIDFDDEYIKFYPTNSLIYDTMYTVIVTNVKDVNNNPARDTAFSFTTEPFHVVESSPSNGSINIERDMAYVSMRFAGNIDTASVRNAIITTTPPLNIVRSYGNSRVYISLLQYLSASTIYTVNVSGVKSSTGKTMKPFELKFATEPIQPIKTTTTIPANNAQNVSINTSIIVNLDQQADTSTIRGCLSISPAVPGYYMYSYPYNSFTFKPSGPLDTSKTYTVTIANTLKNKYGDNAQPYTFSFKTSSQPYIFYDGFENGTSNWILQTPWGTSTTAYLGSYSLTESPSGNYQNNVNVSATMNNSFSLVGKTDPTLTFRERYSTESGYDYCRVEISINGGSSWSTLTSYSGSQTTFNQRTIPLNSYSGYSNCKIRFRFTSDGSAIDDGWYIDEVMIN